MAPPDAPDPLAPPSPAVPPDAADYAAALEGSVIADGVPFALLAVDGADAADFLHAQLSSDIKALVPGNGRWSSYNSPKGRVLATLFVGRLPDGAGGPRFAVWLAADLAATIARRLRMFVLRSKVAITEPGNGSSIGLGGPEVPDTVRQVFEAAPSPPAVFESGPACIAAFPDGRWLVSAPPADLPGLREGFAATRAVPASLWHWLGIRAGVPTIDAATSDRFVAQEANLDAIGAIDFRKGCYPGQEIVARTHYLGRLKERLFLCEADVAPPAGGTRLFHPVFGDQPCGEVVNAAFGPSGNSQFLAVLQIAAGTAPGLALQAPQGPAVRILPLPYALPAPSAPRARLK